MNATVLLALMVGALTAGPLLIAFWLWRRSFIHYVRVAIQTGNDPSDVVWAEDVCKVTERNGTNLIRFRRLKGECQSPSGNFWYKFTPKNLVLDVTKIWKTAGLENKLARGLFLYRSIDGQYHPMEITRAGEFRVLTSDNRAFLIQCDREATALMMTGRQQLFAVIAVVVAIMVLGILFILFLVYLGKNVDSFCSSAQVAANSGIVQTVTSAVGA